MKTLIAIAMVFYVRVRVAIRKFVYEVQAVREEL